MSGPYLIVIVAGDSNAGCGDGLIANPDQIQDSRVLEYQTGTPDVIVTAKEQLQQQGMNPNQVGSTFALCKLLVQRGFVPAGYQILIIGAGDAGNSYQAVWNINNASHTGLDYLVNKLTPALATNSLNRIWFYDWNFGYNEIGVDATYDGFVANMQTLFGYLRANFNATTVPAPVLMVGCPPDFYNLNGHSSVIAGPPGLTVAQAAVSSWLSNSMYVDPSSSSSLTGAWGPVSTQVTANGGPEQLHSYQHNNFIHFSAVSHRGGINDALKDGNFTYNPAATYPLGSGLNTAAGSTYGSDGFLYLSLQNNNTGNDPVSSPTWWVNTNIPYAQKVLYPLSERKFAALMNLGLPTRTTW